MNADLEYVAVGGNRHPSAADWAPDLLVFGAGNNLAIWDPEDHRQNGIVALLAGHTDVINAVKIVDLPIGRHIITGGADHTIRIWGRTANGAYPYYTKLQCLEEHQGSVNTISCLSGKGVFAAGAADATVKIWQFYNNGPAKHIQSISLKPRYLPLATAIVPLLDGSIVLAVAGTSSAIQIYVRPMQDGQFELQATLTGHEGWVRSLDFIRLSGDESSDLLLASASQDKYIRLWRFHNDAGGHNIQPIDSADPSVVSVKKALSNKTHTVNTSASKYTITFEALLIGHEDWIYTAKWAPREHNSISPVLLSASADNSLAIWTADEASSVWICSARLGEINAQKGSTTATGSAGGFWMGLWQPNAISVVCLGRTGSWRRWLYDQQNGIWMQQLGIGGHTREVQGLAWATDGSYLLSTSSDQSTRLFAEWNRNGQSSWHEFARPQIHGYDLNCIDTLTHNQFISGADEKLLRVFNKPKTIDHLLSKLSNSKCTVNDELADAANIPVLGLSNKAIAAVADGEPADHIIDGHVDEREAVGPASVVHKPTLDLEHPPFEDHLARYTLWPEHEKLYGHGYEISAVTTSHDNALVATACKASSIDYAVIRVYETSAWREVKPPLTAHTLTVTSLAFSPDDLYLLSVGRDRQCAVFERDMDDPFRYNLSASNPKAHARMILDCAWAPMQGSHVFSTAGRDKLVKIWRLAQGEAECMATCVASSSVTAVAFCVHDMETKRLMLAYGKEDGSITLAIVNTSTFELTRSSNLEVSLCPSKAVNALQWRPGSSGTKQLAAASEDGSLRILNVREGI